MHLLRIACSGLRELRFAWVAPMLALPFAVGAQPWQDALARMPMAPVRQLNRTNCVETILRAFRKDDVVKALVFMPGATDEFYFFRRATAVVTNSSPTLLDAVSALTNQTHIRATFRSPLLLLHTAEDPTEPDITVNFSPAKQRLEQTSFLPRAIYNDADWDALQPTVRKTFKAEVYPYIGSTGSWHFYRHSFAGWNLTDWEALEAITLAGKSKCVIQKQGGLSLRRTALFFEPDRRVQGIPGIRIER
jgi:hypothetical protein